MCLGEKLLLLGELGLELITVLLIVGVLLLILCELSLKAWFPLSLGLLVGVDLARGEELVEGDARVGCDY